MNPNETHSSYVWWIRVDVYWSYQSYIIGCPSCTLVLNTHIHQLHITDMYWTSINGLYKYMKMNGRCLVILANKQPVWQLSHTFHKNSKSARWNGTIPRSTKKITKVNNKCNGWNLALQKCNRGNKSTIAAKRLKNLAVDTCNRNESKINLDS